MYHHPLNPDLPPYFISDPYDYKYSTSLFAPGLDIFGSSDYFQPVLKILIISVLILDIFGSSDYFQPVLKILIISVLILDIFGSSDYFQPVLTLLIISGANMLTLTF